MKVNDIGKQETAYLTKDRFAWIILSYIICLQLWQRTDIALESHQFWVYLYKITRTLISSLCYGHSVMHMVMLNSL